MPDARPLLIGGAGVRNFGDELIVRLWLDFYLAAGLGSPVVAVNSPDFMRRLFRSHAGQAEFTRFVHDFAQNQELDFWSNVAEGLRLTEMVDPAAAIDAIGAEPTSVHIHGGGYLNSMWPKTGFRLGAAVALARAFSCPLFATGLGLLPQRVPPANEAIVASVIAAFEVFETRDRQSYEFLTQFAGQRSNVINGLDDVYLVPVRPWPNGIRTLSVAGFNRDDFTEFLSGLPQTFYDGFDRVVFWECATKGSDAQVGALLASRSALAEVLPLETLLESLPALGFGDVMLTSRFHPHLLAARMGVVGAFRPDDGYYDVKHGSVVELGSGLLPISAFDAATPVGAGAGIPRIVEREDELVGRKRKVAAQLAATLRQRGPLRSRTAPDNALAAAV